MLLNIVFSYNRALQLDCFLKSFIRHMKNPDYKVVIVYHTTENHAKSYLILKDMYRSNNRLEFIERQSVSNYYLKIIPLLAYYMNVKRIVKHVYLRKGVDNFKFLVERIIEKSGCEFTMFSTDDTFYDNDILFNNSIGDLIKQNPWQTSYRLFLGKNIFAESKPNFNESDNFLTWDYYKNDGIKGWGYPFTVDGTIYDSNSILEILKIIIYHMPATLESFVNSYVVKNFFFSKGICPKISCLSNIWINRVQEIGFHKSANVDTDFLNKKFINGYSLSYNYIKPVKEFGTIPKSLIFTKGKIHEVIEL